LTFQHQPLLKPFGSTSGWYQLLQMAYIYEKNVFEKNDYG